MARVETRDVRTLAVRGPEVGTSGCWSLMFPSPVDRRFMSVCAVLALVTDAVQRCYLAATYACLSMKIRIAFHCGNSGSRASSSPPVIKSFFPYSIQSEVTAVSAAL